jgi:RNA polymerase sigma-70 factor (ECF subfamily)
VTVAARDIASAAASQRVGAGQQDDALPFEVLFRNHWSRVYSTLVRLTGDHEEAEDLALEVFLRLHRRPLFAGTGANLAGWLYRVATRLGLNALRDRRRRQHHESEAQRLILDESRAAGDPAADLERAETRLQVRRALARMKPRSAKLLVLRHAGLSYAELAEALGVSTGSVGTLLARAEGEFEKRYATLHGDRG